MRQFTSLPSFDSLEQITGTEIGDLATARFHDNKIVDAGKIESIEAIQKVFESNGLDGDFNFGFQ
ncbi:MAG: hypothetical protein AAF483_27480 [Planctomycetota bacterium]